MPTFYGELYRSKSTGKYHWRLVNMYSGLSECGTAGGKNRGYDTKADAKGMFYRIHGDLWELIDETEE